MNNSYIASNSLSLDVEDLEVKFNQLRERESVLIRLITAIESVQSSEEWSTLKSVIFDSREESLEKQIRSESMAQTIDDSELYRLQGRLFEAKKYDLGALVESYRVELRNIKKLIPTD